MTRNDIIAKYSEIRYDEKNKLSSEIDVAIELVEYALSKSQEDADRLSAVQAKMCDMAMKEQKDELVHKFEMFTCNNCELREDNEGVCPHKSFGTECKIMCNLRKMIE